jgi:hypothetical protein
MLFNRSTHFTSGTILAAIATIATIPVLAETANFGTLTRSRGFQSPTALLRGSTGDHTLYPPLPTPIATTTNV